MLNWSRCCNTCDELIKAYQEKQWSISNILRNSTQCIHDRANHFASVVTGEGCRVTGSMKVNKVSGNFHIAHGESIVRDARHIHHFNPAEAPNFNISHTIHSLSFGEAYPNMPRNPLDSVRRIIKQDTSTGLYQYFIKIIPTIYTDTNREEVYNPKVHKRLYTSQFTVTERFREFVMPKMDGSDKVMVRLYSRIIFLY